jgi:hypothetical protein
MKNWNIHLSINRLYEQLKNTDLQGLCNRLAKWTETWWEAPMEGSVLSFLEAEWKVSDTGSAHWASSFYWPYKLEIYLSVLRPWMSLQQFIFVIISLSVTKTKILTKVSHLPSFDSFGKVFQKRIFFRNQPIRNKNCLWRPCLSTDRK